MTAEAHCIVVRGEGEDGEESAQIAMGMHGPMVGTVDNLQPFASQLAATFPNHKYTICRLVPVEDATRIH